MNCPICGAPIAEGAAFCNNCGSPVAQQPQQGIQYQQPGQQYQQPGPQYQQQYQQPGQQYQQPGPQYQQPGQMYQDYSQNQNKFGASNGGNIMATITKDPFMICTCVGLFFMFISSWFPRWVQASGYGGAGLFASNGGILKLYAFLFIAIVAWEVIIHFNVIPEVVGKFRSLPFSQFYLPALALIVWILCMTNSNFRMYVNAGKQVKELTGVSTSGYGFIAWLCLISILLLLVRPVMKIVKKEQYWDF